MDNRQKLQQLFRFDLWANRKLVDVILKQTPFDEQQVCISFLSHIINAQEIWFERVIGLDFSDIEIWTEYPLDELKTKAKEANQKWIDLIGDHEVNMDTLIHYGNSKGVNFRNELWQICHHLIIHGQHHRAQISLFLRKCDIKPPPIDYIFYARSES